jgi:50S ribosomal protein uL11
MAKEVAGLIKLQIRGGAANPSPPVGPALGAKGVNIMEFCKQFNGRTQEKAGKLLPVIITVYADKSFDFIVKTPPVAVQLLEAAKTKKGSSEPNRDKVRLLFNYLKQQKLRKVPRNPTGTKLPLYHGSKFSKLLRTKWLT